MAQLITIGGVTVKRPSDLDIEEYNITKSGRVSSGDMTGEYIAAKVKLLLKYEVLSGAERRAIWAVIRTSTIFFTVTYVDDDNVTYSKTFYVGALKRTQFRTDTGAWYWKNVTFDLIER